MLRLRGGGKKRKKKTYTKPKKVKHVHKAVKLAVLKFYRVDDNGKVQRLRKSCPNEECGVGVRMAVHKDRFYCGKCGLTVSILFFLSTCLLVFCLEKLGVNGTGGHVYRCSGNNSCIALFFFSWGVCLSSCLLCWD